MIASAIIDIAEARFSDNSNIIRSPAEWLAYVNAAYRQFVQTTRWPSLVTTASVTVLAGTRSIVLSAAALQGGVVAVFDGARPLMPQPADLPWKRVQFMADQPSTPVWYQIEGGRVTVLPAPTGAKVLTIAYMAAPAALAVGDTPAIPETYHDALVAGALARAYRDDGAVELAREYDTEFAGYLAAGTKDAVPGTAQE